jgi:hypothetical protein
MDRHHRLKAAEWILAFQHRLRFLGVRVDADSLFDMAVEIHARRGDRDPIREAQAEWESWPPNRT